jgi:hypothetical protein
MNNMYVGSICLTDLIEAAKRKHSAFNKSQNGKIYANVILWHNEEPDKFGNTHSLQLNSQKDKREMEGKTYLGNLKPPEVKAPAPISDNDTKTLVKTADDLPF